MSNTAYGCTKDKNNPLYDPLQANNVCITGQLLLLDLCEKIEIEAEKRGWLLIQNNTDGTMWKLNSREEIPLYEAICDEWSERTRMGLEHEIITKVVQKDVNNYVVVHEEGDVKAKGGYVKQLSDIDYDLSIINKALKDYFIYNTPVEDTINNCDELREFQKIVKVSRLYTGAYYGDELLKERILRVFASTDENAKGVFKVHKNKEGVFDKIPNTPMKCFIDNDDIVDKKVPVDLDKQYYIDMAIKRIDDFLEVTEVDVNKWTNILDELLNKFTNYYDFLEYNKLHKLIGKVKLMEFIKLRKLEQYGLTNKLIKSYEYFDMFYGKKSPKKATINKTIKNESILEMLSRYSEETETTYKNLNSFEFLKELLSTIPNEDLPYIELLRYEWVKTRKLTYINDSISPDELFVTSVNSSHTPYVIAYCVNNGSVMKFKIKNDIFDVIDIREDDLVKAKEFKQSNKLEFYGIDIENKKAISRENTDMVDYWISDYDIISRTY